MKRMNFILAAVSFLALTAACDFSSSSAALDNSSVNTANQSNVNKATPTPENKNVSQTASTETKNSFVIIGSVYWKEGKLVTDDDFLGHEENSKEAAAYPKNKVALDILNCAGYLASATTDYKIENGVRKVKLLSETVASDAMQKIKQCAAAPDDKIIQNKVFAVAPPNERRRNIRIEKIDAKKIYQSLTAEMAKIKMMKSSDAAPIPLIKATKGTLSLESDNWTDSDGDGTIDLIEFHDEPCENENDSCTWIFQMIDGKWRNIDYIFPL